MKMMNILIMTVLAATAGSAFAEGGSERSQEFWKQFKISQEQVHGSQSAVADATAKEASTKKSEG